MPDTDRCQTCKFCKSYKHILVYPQPLLSPCQRLLGTSSRSIAMTIELTRDQFYEQFQAADEEQLQWDPSDERDITYKFDAHISQGWRREIELRAGLWLNIDHHQQVDRLVIRDSEREAAFINLIFMLSGKGKHSHACSLTESEFLWSAGKYGVGSNGTVMKNTGDYAAVEPCSFLDISARPEVLRAFAASPEGELPQRLQHLVKHPHEALYYRQGNAQPLMNSVIQQILHCSYQGLLKRMYLESKVIELIALVLDHDSVVQQGDVISGRLKPEQLERVHYAREILLKDLSNPPTLEQLARQVGLNDFLLKQGFRQAFGTTVYEMLKSYRLELAQQLLAERNMSVAEIAHLIGYGSSAALWRAFKQKFGVSPKQYQKMGQQKIKRANPKASPLAGQTKISFN